MATASKTSTNHRYPTSNFSSTPTKTASSTQARKPRRQTQAVITPSRISPRAATASAKLNPRITESIPQLPVTSTSRLRLRGSNSTKTSATHKEFSSPAPSSATPTRTKSKTQPNPVSQPG